LTLHDGLPMEKKKKGGKEKEPGGAEALRWDEREMSTNRRILQEMLLAGKKKGNESGPEALKNQGKRTSTPPKGRRGTAGLHMPCNGGRGEKKQKTADTVSPNQPSSC